MRKFSEYFAQVISEEGNEFNSRAENKTSYKETLKLYNTLKNQFPTAICVSLMGVKEDNSIEVMFKKECEKQPVSIEAGYDVISLLETLVDTTTKIKKRVSEIKDVASVYDKMVDSMLHTLACTQFSQEEKLTFFDDLQNAVTIRRDAKNEMTLCQSLQSKMTGIEEFNTYAGQKLKSLDDYIKAGKNKYALGKDVVVEFPFTDETSKQQSINKAKKYDRTIVDTSKNVVYAYNNAVLQLK